MGMFQGAFDDQQYCSPIIAAAAVGAAGY